MGSIPSISRLYLHISGDSADVSPEADFPVSLIALVNYQFNAKWCKMCARSLKEKYASSSGYVASKYLGGQVRI